MTELRGRVAVVTGGSRGIGEAVALALAAAGCDVGLLARSAADVERVASRVRDRGRRARAAVADVTDTAAVRAGLADIAGALGPVDVAVLNAGVIDPLGPTLDLDPDEWSRVLDVNVGGAVRVLREVGPGMVARGWGRIVGISSGAADPPGMASASAYSASKVALEMLLAHLADELAGTGVTVNAVRPGVVDTGMQELMRSKPRDRVGERFHDRFHGLHQRGELAPPERPAEFVARLVATGLTGEVLDARVPGHRAKVGQT